MDIFKVNKNKGILLKKHIQQKNWRQVQRIIAYKNNHCLTIPCDTSSSSHYECSPLPYVCKHDPPLHIISTILKVNPSSVFKTDCKKNLPLHLACQYGASPRVITALLSANENGAMQRNIDGMLPIHMTCHYYHYPNAGTLFMKKTSSDALLEVIRALLAVQPDMLLEEDDNEMCPIEHALAGNMNADIFHVLQEKALIAHYKKLQEQYESEREVEVIWMSK